MAKTKKRPKPSPSKKPAAATNEDGNDQQQEDEVGWSSIPGKRLRVDIADTSATAAATGRRRGGGASSPGSDDDDNGEFNTDKWMSQHYDEESDNEQRNQQADSDLFDPDPRARTNKFDAGSKLAGANDDGMFMR